MSKTIFPRAVLFDLLTALLDSWTLWNSVAGSEAAGGMWRGEYLRLTYGCGAYVPYEQLVRTAARTAGPPGTGAGAPGESPRPTGARGGGPAGRAALRGRNQPGGGPPLLGTHWELVAP